MYLFIYKTTHINGRYYIGRHQTENLDDGYLGSGNWVSGIKDKSELHREIIAEATSIDELIRLEEEQIAQHFNDPLNMNFKRASVGLTSEDARERAIEKLADGTHPFIGLNERRVANGTHNFIGGEIARTTARKQIENGTHKFLNAEFQAEVLKCQLDRVANGTHNLLGPETNAKRLKDGTHHFLNSEVQRTINLNRVAKGTHHFIGPENNLKRMLNGTHNFLSENSPSQFKWACPHCGKEGKGKGNYTKNHGDKCKKK